MPKQQAAEGDIIEWMGANKIHQGKIVSKGDTMVCMMENGFSFQLNDLRYAKSVKLIKK